MPKQREIPPEVVENLRVRIQEERNILRSQLAARIPRKRDSKRNTRGRLRQVFEAWQELTYD